MKPMNNSIFGKTIQNVDKITDVRLATSLENTGKRLGARSLIAKSYMKNFKIFTEDFVAIEIGRLNVTYDKPIYVGFSVLEISKFIMYMFYNFV